MPFLFIVFVSLFVVLVGTVIRRFTSAPVGAQALAGLTAWFVYATVLGYWGSRISTAGPTPLPMLLALPAAGLVVFCARSRFRRNLANAIPAYAFIGLESFRIAVELTLHRLWLVGLVPRMLTYEGANFDIVIGLTAPLVAWLVASKKLTPRGAITWNLLGIALLVNVVVRSALTTPGPTHLINAEVVNRAVTSFPYTFIPGLLAPLAVLLHVLAIRALRSPGAGSVITHCQHPVVLITGASRRFVARLLGMSNGTTYHDTLPSRPHPVALGLSVAP